MVATMAAFREERNSVRSDRELIADTLAGDHDAFAVLVDRFQRRIFRLAHAIVRDEVEADAITQDTFVQAYINLSRFEGRSEFETWLTRIAINRSRDALRRPRTVSLMSAALEPADDRPDPERELAAEELRAALECAERKLSAKQKMIFRLRHYEGCSLEEIAGVLGLRSATVRVHLFRAVHKIRHELAGWTNKR